METNDSLLSWNTTISRTAISSVQGFGFSRGAHSAVGLDDALHTLQKLNVKRCHMHDIERQSIVGEGESFVVEQSVYAGEVVAVKHLKMCESGGNLRNRLDKVLLDLQIMHHKPLRSHPNILRLIGYGWNMQVNNQPRPFVMVEYAHMGNFREYLWKQQGGTTLDKKSIFIGDVAAGLMALHDCGIVHGDLKLDNVLAFPSRDRPSNVIAKICDFGHSLVLSQENHQRNRYRGTSRYNAPEVVDQSPGALSSQDLDLQKCDIWAYGLLVWEILKDGECYLDKSWIQDRSHFKDLSGALEASDDLLFSRFNKSHLQELAVTFLKEKFSLSRSIGTASALSTAILRGVLVKTLHMEPASRPSDLRVFPLMSTWNKSGTVELSTLLSVHSGKSELTYELFRQDQGGDIQWLYQQQIFEELERTFLRLTDTDTKASIAIQLATCYILGFGTRPQFNKAIEKISQAESLGHPVAQVFGGLLSSGLSGGNVNTYNSCIIRSLRAGVLGITPQNHTALICACSLAETATARRLIDEGVATSHHSTSDGLTPLHLLFIFGDEALPVARKLLEQWGQFHNPNPSPPTRLVKPKPRGISVLRGWLSKKEPTPPALSNMMSPKQVLDQLCTESRRIHPQWPLEFRGTPLAFAICAQSEKAIAALLELGANPLTKIYPLQENGTGDQNKWTAFHLAASLHCPRILSNLIQAAKAWNENTSISLVECFREAPLGCTLPFSSKLERYSIHGGKSYQSLLETVQLLTFAGACAVSPTGMTPLMQAIDFEDHDVVSALIECYPSLLRTKFFSPTEPQDWNFPVHFAAQLAGQSDGALRILKLLVERDLRQSQSLSVVDSRGRSLLHLAVTGRSSLAAEWLLQRNPDAVNSRDNHGRFPLHYVSTVENAAKLFAHGAKLSPRVLDGLSPLHYICKRGCKDVVDWFIEHNVTLDTGDLLHSAILGKSYSIVSTLLEQGVPMDETNSEGDTPLHVATRTSQADIVRALLQKNADTSVINSDRQTPLHLACSMGSPTIVRLILSREKGRVIPGVFSAQSLDAKDAKGQTPLHIAARTANTTIGKLLLDHGASECIQDDEGRTPLHEAASLTKCEEAEQEAFCRLLLRCKDLLIIRDASGHLAWHLAWMGRRLQLLSLFFSTAYSLAGNQLQCESPGDHVGGDELVRAAIHKKLPSLIKTLLEQRETLGIQIPRGLQKTVRAHVESALLAACHFRSCTKYLEAELLKREQHKTITRVSFGENYMGLWILDAEIFLTKIYIAKTRLAECRLAEKVLEFRVVQAKLAETRILRARLEIELAEAKIADAEPTGTRLVETALQDSIAKAEFEETELQTRATRLAGAKIEKTGLWGTEPSQNGPEGIRLETRIKDNLSKPRITNAGLGTRLAETRLEIGAMETKLAETKLEGLRLKARLVKPGLSEVITRMPLSIGLDELVLKLTLEPLCKEHAEAKLFRKVELLEDESGGSRVEAEGKAEPSKARIAEAILELKLAKTALKNKLAEVGRTETRLKTELAAVEGGENSTGPALKAVHIEKELSEARVVPLLLGETWSDEHRSLGAHTHDPCVIVTADEFEDRIYASSDFAEHLTGTPSSMIVVTHNDGTCDEYAVLPGWVCARVWKWYGLDAYWENWQGWDLLTRDASPGFGSSYYPLSRPHPRFGPTFSFEEFFADCNRMKFERLPTSVESVLKWEIE